MENVDATEKGNDYGRLSSKELEDIVDCGLSKIKQLSAEEKQKKNEEIKILITRYDEITNFMEERRVKVSDASRQTIATVVTAAGVVVALDIPLLQSSLIYIGLASLLIPAIATLIEYQFQSKYGYLFRELQKYGNQWKWFYYGNPYITRINYDPFRGKEFEDENLNHYLRGLGFFVDNYRDENLDSELHANITQLYLMQVHNFYKNKFYLRLLRYSNWVVWLLLAGFILYIVIILIHAKLAA